jgi:hypothetical protein
MLAPDARITIDPGLFADSRVEQFWDADNIAGAWFAEEIEGYSGTAWDVYYLYGPDAEWVDVPAPLISSGATVIGERKTLETNIRPLLGN